MVTFPRTPPPPPAPRRLAVALVLVVCCCALALACLSAAAALPGRPQLTARVAADRTPADGRQGSGTGEQQSSGREPRGRERPDPGDEQPAADSEQPASDQEQPSSGGGEQQSSGGGAQSGSGGDQSSSGSRARRGATRGAQQQGRGATRGAPQQGSTGRAGEQGGSGRGSGGGSRGQQAPASASGTAPAAPAAASPTATPALAPSTPSTSTTTTAAATPPVAVSPPQVASAPPAVTRRLPQAPTRRAPGRHGTQHARPARARATSRGLAPAAVSGGAVALGTTVPDASTRARRARGAARRHRPHSRSSPLVTTITTIVDVVPVPLRVLLGVLFVLAVALGLRSRVVALRARRLERQRAQLLEDVGLLQAALLPVAPARLGPVGTSAAYRPADGPGAGGDFYDVFALADGRLAVIVGDISGHGRQALPHTALVRFTLRAYLEAGLSPRSAVQTAGAVLERQLGDSFATVVAATYQPRDRVLVYACAGHPPPIVLGAQSLALVTLCSSPPIGVGMRTGTRQTTVSLPGSGQVCFHTDGVTDARVGRELFGELRLARTLAQLASGGSGGSGATASALLGRVAAETDARPDDMAACLLCVEGAADTPPTVLVEELELDREAAAAGRTEQFLLACGVAAGEIPELVCSARAAAGHSGTALLELRLDDGQPVVSLHRDNVTPLEAPRTLRRAGLGVSR